MFRNRLRFVLLCLVVLGFLSQPVLAQRVLQTVNITEMIQSPLAPNHVLAPVISMRHDPRCSVPVKIAINTTLDPVPNPLGEDFLALDDAVEVLHEAAQVWNDIPTSYFEIAFEGTSQNEGSAALDFVNEVTFRPGFTFGFLQPQGTLAFYGLMSLTELHFISSDANLTDGLDFDGDGDADAVDGIETCMDVDGDGDLEYPTGLYPAGTILDFDIQFGASDTDNALFGLIPGTRFTVDPAAIDDELFSVDLRAVAVPSFGIVHAVAHTMINQPSDTDGIDATFYPFIDTTDPQSEIARGAGIDDDAIAQVSFLYPEGSAAEGPAALQEGDVAFDDVYGLIEGSVYNSAFDNPAAGVSVSARDRSTGRLVSTTYSGQRSNLEYDPAIDALLIPIDPAFNSPDGDYTLVVPDGLYDIAIEAPDGTPILPFPVNLSAQIGAFIGVSLANEEYYSGGLEGAFERSPALSTPVRVRAGETVGGIDFVTNTTIDIIRHGFTQDAYSERDQAAGTYFAVRIPGEDFAAADPGPRSVAHAAHFLTAPARSSQVAVFEQALVTTGSLNGDGSPNIDMDDPIAVEAPFVGQDEDYTPLYFRNSLQALRDIRKRLAGADEDIFLVIQLPIDNGGAEMPRILLDGGIDENDAPIFGDSFMSTDGGQTWTQDTTFNYMFNLVLSEYDPRG